MKISTILDHIDNGHMALPEFQRGYVWNRDQVRGLFDSLYRRHPVGGLLVWATESQSAAHRGDGALSPGVVNAYITIKNTVPEMKNYYRIILGRKNKYAEECFAGSFIGVDFDVAQDLSGDLPERWQDFNKKFRPIWMELNPGKSKIAAGLSCSFLHIVCKGIHEGDIVLCPDGQGAYRVGEVTEPYSYHAGSSLPHRRRVHWQPTTIRREDMSVSLRNSSGSIGTACNLTKYSGEIERLLAGKAVSELPTDGDPEDPTVFGLEKHLEEFLVANWQSTELGRDYDIYEEDGELVGQQYPCDTGPLDILAISKDRKKLLVVELKKGRASDAVVGQIQRYMGYVLDELAEPDQTVAGVIIALEDDLRIRRALRVAQGIEFYRYEVSFKLVKQDQ